MLLESKKFILDTLFPISCLACEKSDEWICDKCLSKMPTITDQSCPICEKTNTPDGRVCFSCRKETFLDAMLVCSSYKNELVSTAVHYLKYRFVRDMGKPLAKLIATSLYNSEIPVPNIIIPVPLHPHRLRWRGFNQAQLLAQHTSENFMPEISIPIETEVLIRIKRTPPQMKIKNIKKRKENISKAFSVTNTEKIKEKTILLIDDVSTTGNTIFECAKTLKENGAKKVFATVIARQSYF